MEDAKENITFKSLSQEELVARPNDEEKYLCTASECIFPRWSKPVRVHQLMFVSKDVLLMHVENTLTFFNVKTREENILIVGDSRSTPDGGGALRLNGISCVDCCGIDLLALAEQPPAAKVIICRYPDLKVLATLIDDDNSAAYKSVLFLRLEYLIGLRDHPAFDLIVWAWRVREKLLVIDTGFIQPNQSLSVSAAAGRDVHLSQTERGVRCRLQLWTVFVGSRTAHAQNTPVAVPGEADVRSACWTPSGWLVFCGGPSERAYYRVQPGVPRPRTRATRLGDGSSAQLVCGTAQGFVLCASDGLTCYKDTKGIFTKCWTITIDHALQCMVAEENDVYGWSYEGVLFEFTQKNEQNVLKVYGIHIKYFTFVKPADDTVVTINDKNNLQLWDVSTGDFKCEIKLNGVATNLCSNPLFNYIAVSFENGKVELLKTDPKVEHISKIVLCDEELSSVNFFSNGKDCIVTSFPTGHFYRININLGQACSVIKEYILGCRVIDIEIFECNNSSFLTVLYKTHNSSEVAGNNIKMFNMDFSIVFELKDTQFYYTSLFEWNSFDAPNTVCSAFTVLLSKNIHLMKINIVQAKVLDCETIKLDHNVRDVKVSLGRNNYCVTFGHDGAYSLYEFHDNGKWGKIVTVSASQWQTGGLKEAKFDGNVRNILTLSHQGHFMCTSFKETCNHVRRSKQIDTIVTTVNDMKTEGIGNENGSESSKRMTWTEINKQNELNAMKIAYSEKKSQIIREFEGIKEELVTLLETNINGPEDAKINIEEFDLNVDNRLMFREQCRIQRLEYEAKILWEINEFKLKTENILKEHWECLLTKPKSIHCLVKIYKVDNYPIRKTDQDVVQKANQIIAKRILVKEKKENNISVTDDDTKNNLKALDDQPMLSELDFRQKNDILLTGSISHKIIDDFTHFNSQYDYYKLEMAEDEIVLLQFAVNELKRNFNKLFDDMFVEKQRKLDKLKEFNDRLRAIENEFRLACKAEPTEPSPVDFEWSQFEKTEKLTHVEDDEVYGKTCHILSSKQIFVNTNETKAEYSEKLLTSDDFRQRALVNMMEGVLEKKWEDELKKDVPQPQCMAKKSPAEYTEDDLKTINEYKNAVMVRNEERTKYKKILEEEKTKINEKIKEIVDTFDDSLFQLFQAKSKYNLAISQEYLKIGRLSKMLNDSVKRKQLIEQYKENVLETEKAIEETTKKIVKIETTHNSLLNTVEALKHKSNVLNKRFKSEFPSKLIYEQALIAYNRRPKIQGIKNYSSLLGYQFVNAILDPTDDKLDLLCPEFVKYLDNLRAYDDYKYVEDYKLNMGRETWQKVCNFRRAQIESELKISTCQKDAVDKANLLDNLTRDKENKEAVVETFKTLIDQLNDKDSLYENDPEIQLVMRQGNAEVNLTGHYKDFCNTVLVDKPVIERVNAEIKEMGKLKIDMLSSLLLFKRKCKFLKWEHVILKKHKIALYRFRCDVITSMKVTESMLRYLEFRAKGTNIVRDAEQKLEKELAGIQITFSKEKKELVRRLDELVDKIRSVKRENEISDRNIEQMNVHLSELKSKIDYSLTNRLKSFSDTRMKNIMKRTQMISSIQELHKAVNVLQTELELLMLKTFPTLYNPSPSASVKK